MGKIFALDYGKARIGLASCHPMIKIPTPFMTFKMLENHEKSSLALGKILIEAECQLLIVGLPLELSGKEGPMAQETRAFIAHLEKHLPTTKIEFLDERLTSAQAEKAMISMEFSRKKRAGASDTMAACLILETYLSKGLI